MNNDGWPVFWTTAPEDYDWFGTTTLEHCGEWRGKKLRKAAADPQYVESQRDRYASGLHGSWDEDPREVEAQFRAAQEREAAERAAREARRAAGLEWMKTAEDGELKDWDTFEEHGVEFTDARAELERRAAERESEAKATEYVRCLALVPIEGCLVDDGAPAQRGRYGPIGGRDPHVWYRVRVREYPACDPEAEVVAEGGEVVGALDQVAQWLTDGRLRQVPAADLPPRAVVERLGHRQWKDIVRCEVAGRALWAGRPQFSMEVMVLDDRGYKVRAKKAAAIATQKYWQSRGL